MTDTGFRRMFQYNNEFTHLIMFFNSTYDQVILRSIFIKVSGI